VIVLVRHADAGDKHRWAARDELRPLSPKGLRHAEESIVPLLAGLGVTRLLSSPALRCLQTLLPTGARLGLVVEPCDELAVRAPVDLLLQLLEEPSTDQAALCTHGETLTALSKAWNRTGRTVLDTDGAAAALAGTPKGGAWIIDGYHGATATARYVPPHRQVSSEH